MRKSFWFLVTLCACSPNEMAVDGVTVHFPISYSLTDAQAITVRGTAADVDGIAAIRINGMLASTTDEFANWQLSVPLSPGENSIIIESEDTQGNIQSPAAQLVVYSGLIRSEENESMELDLANNRVLVTDIGLDAVVAIDLKTGTRTIISDTMTGSGVGLERPDDIALDVANNRALIVDADLGALVEVDLSSGDRTVISDSSTGSGVELQVPRRIALDETGSHAYVVDTANDSIVEVDLATGDRTTLSDAFISPVGIAIDTINSRAIVADIFGDTIYSTDLNSGDTEILSSEAVGSGPALEEPRRLTLDMSNNRALVLCRSGSLHILMSVDLTSGNRSFIVSGIPYFADLTFDEEGARALAVNFDSLSAIDLATREQTSITPRGSGPKLQGPMRAALDPSNNRALVIDSTEMGRALLSIDMVSGDRTVVIDAEEGTGALFSEAWDIVLREDGSQAFVIANNPSMLMSLDMVSGERVVISDGTTGSGPAMQTLGGLTLSARENRAYVIAYDIDLQRAYLLAIDLTSGDRSVLSGGSGPNLETVNDLALDAVGGRVIVVDAGLDALVSIDLESGDRTVISDAVVGSGPALRIPTTVVLDAANDRALVTDASLEALVSVDLTSGDRSVLTNFTAASGARAGTLDPESGVLLATHFNPAALVAVDVKTGERVVISGP